MKLGGESYCKYIHLISRKRVTKSQKTICILLFILFLYACVRCKICLDTKSEIIS